MRKDFLYGWFGIGMILSVILGPAWVPVLMGGMLLFWLYDRQKNEKFCHFWKKWGGLYWLASLLCIFRFSLFVPVFVFLGMVIDYMIKVIYK